jgi:hypothetical protein
LVVEKHVAEARRHTLVIAAAATILTGSSRRVHNKMAFKYQCWINFNCLSLQNKKGKVKQSNKVAKEK